jgi:hypothetical protein
MSTHLSKLAAIVLMMMTLGCGRERNGSSTFSQSPCEANQWAIVPTHILTFPGSVGFKLIQVTLAVENNSPFWGQINTALGDPIRQSFLTTEEGLIYPAARQAMIEADIPYFAQVNDWWLVSSQLYTHSVSLIPPGFATHGEAMIGFDVVEDGYGNPNTWSQAVYQVADHQNKFTLTIPSLTISCIHQDNQNFQETIGPINVEVDGNIRQSTYPTARPDSEFTSIAEPITIPNKGVLELQDINYEAGMVDIRYLVMNFKLTNTSTNPEKYTSIRPILLGNDGLTRRPTYVYGPPGCSSEENFSASSAQSTNVTLCYQVGSKAANFKLLWIDEENGFLKVYDLPEGF